MQPETAMEPLDPQQQGRQYTTGPPQLPPLVKGEKIQTGPYTTTVTEEMVAQRERDNQELYRAWLSEQRRREMRGEEGNGYAEEFKEGSVRRSFVRKVFCILTVQLLFTAFVVAIFIFVDSAKKFMILHWYIWVIALIAFMISYCAVSCSQYARRRPPCNYICLVVLTVAMSYLSAFASVFYSVEVVFIAVSMTAVVTLVIGVLATFTKFDLTMRAGMMLIVGLVTVIGILVMSIVLVFAYSSVLHLIIAILGSLLISMYLYFDIQTIMGGRRVELSPDEVIFATVQLYVDILLLYQYLLMCMGLVHDG